MHNPLALIQGYGVAISTPCNVLHRRFLCIEPVAGIRELPSAGLWTGTPCNVRTDNGRMSVPDVSEPPDRRAVQIKDGKGAAYLPLNPDGRRDVSERLPCTHIGQVTMLFDEIDAS